MITTLENKYVQQLIADLAKEKILFSLDQEETVDHNGKRKLQNVVFERGNRKLKIYNGIFFREGGICCVLVKAPTKSKKEKDSFVKIMDITDEMFYQLQKQTILEVFNPPIKKEHD